MYEKIVRADLLSIAYGTSLPSSPYDTQLAILVDSTSNPTYEWMFRYNAGSASSYKWEFIGGVPARLSGGSLNTSSTTLQALTSGAQFTIPRSGDYIIDFGIFAQQNGSFTGPYNMIVVPYDVTAAGALGANATFVPVATFNGSQIMNRDYVSAAVASHVIENRVQISNGQPSAFSVNWFTVEPARVS